MNNHSTPFASKFFGLGAALLVAALIFGAQVDDATKAPKDPEKTRQEIINSMLKAQADDKLAAKICGNAGWRLSKDEKHVECIPRRGKPYTAQ